MVATVKKMVDTFLEILKISKTNLKCKAWILCQIWVRTSFTQQTTVLWGSEWVCEV